MPNLILMTMNNSNENMLSNPGSSTNEVVNDGNDYKSGVNSKIDVKVNRKKNKSRSKQKFNKIKSNKNPNLIKETVDYGSNQVIDIESTISNQNNYGMKLVGVDRKVLTPKTLTGMFDDFDKTTISVMKNEFYFYDSRCLDSDLTKGFYREFIDRWLSERGILDEAVSRELNLNELQSDVFTIRNASFEAYATLLTFSRKISCCRAKDLSGDSKIGEIFSRDLSNRFTNIPTAVMAGQVFAVNPWIEMDYKDVKVSNAVWKNDYISQFSSFYLTPSSISYCEELFQDYIEIPHFSKISIFLDNTIGHARGDYLGRIRELKSAVDNLIAKRPYLRGILLSLGYQKMMPIAMNITNDLSRSTIRTRVISSINSSVYNWPGTWLSKYDPTVRYNETIDENTPNATLGGYNPTNNSGYTPDVYVNGPAIRSFPIDPDDLSEHDNVEELDSRLAEIKSLLDSINSIQSFTSFLSDGYTWISCEILPVEDDFNEVHNFSTDRNNRLKEEINRNEVPNSHSIFRLWSCGKGTDFTAAKIGACTDIRNLSDIILQFLDKSLLVDGPEILRNFLNEIESVMHVQFHRNKDNTISCTMNRDSTMTYTEHDNGAPASHVHWFLNDRFAKPLYDCVAIMYELIDELDSSNHYLNFVKKHDKAHAEFYFAEPHNYSEYQTINGFLNNVIDRVDNLAAYNKALKSNPLPKMLEAVPVVGPIISTVNAISEKAGEFTRVKEILRSNTVTKEQIDKSQMDGSLDPKKGESKEQYGMRLTANFHYQEQFNNFEKVSIYSIKHLRNWNAFSIDNFLTEYDTEITLEEFAAIDRFRMLRPNCSCYYNLNRTNNFYKIVPRQHMVTGRISESSKRAMPDYRQNALNAAINFSNILSASDAMTWPNMFYAVYEYLPNGLNPTSWFSIYTLEPLGEKANLDVVEDMNSISINQYASYREICKNEVFHPNFKNELLSKLDNIAIGVRNMNQSYD